MHGLLMRMMISGQKGQKVREQIIILPNQEIFRETGVEVGLGNGDSILELEIVSRGN